MDEGTQPLNNRVTYIGIDPGQNGGIAALFRDRRGITKMPTTDRDILDWLSKIPIWSLNSAAIPYSMAVIEHVHAMPKQGVSSTFKFGVGYGGLRMALTALNIPYEEVQPRAWQKALNIPPRKKTESKTQFKNRLKAKAQQFFPTVEVTLATADALLIALYCKRKHTGTL